MWSVDGGIETKLGSEGCTGVGEQKAEQGAGGMSKSEAGMLSMPMTRPSG